MRQEFVQRGALCLAFLLKLVKGVGNIPIHLLLTIHAVPNWAWEELIPLIKDQQCRIVGRKMGQGQW